MTLRLRRASARPSIAGSGRIDSRAEQIPVDCRSWVLRWPLRTDNGRRSGVRESLGAWGQETKESNPRWRICKQSPSSKNAAKTAVSESGAALGAAVDADLARIMAAWPTLPD